MWNLLYVVFGDSDKHFREAMFSIYSASKFINTDDRWRIIVCTDRPMFFRSMPVHCTQIDEQMLRDWRRPYGYFYRPKIMAMFRIMAEFPATTILIDSDTYFKSSPLKLVKNISPSSSVMHARELPLFSGEYPEFTSLLRAAFPDLVIPTREGEHAISETDSTVWNSGVVGIHKANRGLLSKVIDLTDALCSQVDYFFVEQFAYSEVLRTHTTLHEARHVVSHYWGNAWVDPFYGMCNRDFFDCQIDEFLASIRGLSFEAALDRCRRLELRPFRRPFLFRVFFRIRKMLGLPEVPAHLRKNAESGIRHPWTDVDR